VVGEREATFVDAFVFGGRLLSLGEFCDFGVYKNGDGFVRQGAHEENAQGDADLGSGQADALWIFGVFKRRSHVFDDI